MSSVGGTLRAERLRQGIDLATITTKTKICRPMLEAIEKDEFDSLPPGSYRRNFLRQYAQALGLDEEETVAAFYQQYEEPSLPLPVPPKVTRRSHLREVAWVLAGI